MVTPTEPPVTRSPKLGVLWAVLAVLGGFLLLRQVVLPALGCPT